MTEDHAPICPRLGRILVGAAVPVMLLAGCSSGSDKDSKESDERSPSTSGSPRPPSLPQSSPSSPRSAAPCRRSRSTRWCPRPTPRRARRCPRPTSTSRRAACGPAWTATSTAPDRLPAPVHQRREPRHRREARQDYAKQQAQKATTADGAKKPKSATATGIGESADTVSTESKKDGVDFRNQTVVSRTGNVVVTVEYDGAGYEGGETPGAKGLLKSAEDAAKDVVAAVEKTSA
ncbi:hypothetical protein NKH77_30100 [Streptomyces sp. M19]